jgi:hypothetical protein
MSASSSERYGAKTIKLQGTIKGSSQTDLESKVDAFKELFSRPQKNLEIDWSGGTRRYIATCQHHEFDRDYYHLSIVPWTAEFIAPSGVGQDTSTTEPSDANGDTITRAKVSWRRSLACDQALRQERKLGSFETAKRAKSRSPRRPTSFCGS